MEPTIDLEKLRDEKCIPLAHAVLADAAIDMIPQDANDKVDYNPIVTKINEKTLAANTNLTTENPYIFQLILGVFSGLNAAVQKAPVVPIDDIRYGRIQRQFLQYIVDAGDSIPMGSVTPEAMALAFAPVTEKIYALITKEKLSMMEVKYCMDNIFTSFDMVTNIFAGSIEQHMKRAEAKLFGVVDMTDLDMKTLNDVLITPKPEQVA